MNQLMTIKQASVWATELLGKNVTPSNISYLIQYGRVAKKGDNGTILIDKQDLTDYYNTHYDTKEKNWKKQLGNDLNWHLSFAEYKEAETTKHVHRLHPYKGKFIPQLVEYFLDSHTDEFKQQRFFKAGDIILDPFCGSGTTLVQASELNLHAIGVDISAFNAFISNTKIGHYNIQYIKKVAHDITQALIAFQAGKHNAAFEANLLDELKIFNNQFFPSPEFKYQVRHKQINEQAYAQEKAAQFLQIYNQLLEQYQIDLKQQNHDNFLDKWFLQIIRDEIEFVFEHIKMIEHPATKKILALILSRTMRSCRATTHADLATLKEPVTTTYYCKKHGKICKPLFSILSWWKRYTQDTIKRLEQFTHLRSDTWQQCLMGDSRNIDIIEALQAKNTDFAALIENRKIDGIFSSPPYVGLINYHEQHAYAYDLFGFERKDELEIGPLFKGQGIEARQSYAKGIADVLINCKKFLKPDYDIFLVANDKYGLYPQIAQLAQMKIVNEYKRPVLNRVEKDRSAYAEIIFHLKAL